MAELNRRAAAPGQSRRHQRDDAPGVRLFEIGRGAAYDLSHGERHCAGDACVDVHPDIASIFPRVGGKTVAVWALIAASGALLLVLGSWRVRATCLDVLDWLRDRTPRAWVAVGGIALVVICLGVALIAFVRLEGQHGEPMAFGAGISVWPSEILRMVVALLAVWCLVSIRRALDAMRHEFTALTGPPVDRTGHWSPRARPEGRGAAASAQFQGQRATRGTAP